MSARCAVCNAEPRPERVVFGDHGLSFCDEVCERRLFESAYGSASHRASDTPPPPASEPRADVRASAPRAEGSQ